MKKTIVLILIMVICTAVVFSLNGCFRPQKVKVGIINRYKLLTNWPKYRDLMSEYQVESDLLMGNLPKDPNALSSGNKKDIEKMNKKWREKSRELEVELEKIVAEIAGKKKLDIVITDFSVEYGGIDITDEAGQKLR